MKMKYARMAFGKGKNRIVIIHLNRPLNSGFCGFVRSKLFEDLPMAVDFTNPEETDYDNACLASAANGTSPRIKMEPELFYGIKRNSPASRFILLHEIGHYANQDLQKRSDDYEETRIEQARNGSVMEMELAADAFACAYLGLEDCMDALDELLTRADETELGKIYRSELDLRKKNLIERFGT